MVKLTMRPNDIVSYRSPYADDTTFSDEQDLYRIDSHKRPKNKKVNEYN